MSDERALVNVLKSGNINEISLCFENIYNKYKGLVYFVVVKYVKEEEAVKDITQEVFINFFANIRNINTNIKSYLTSTAKNLSLNYLKKFSHYVEFDEQIDTYYESSDYFNDVLNVLKKYLNDLEIKILLLHILDDLPFNQLGKDLHMSENSIKTIYYRALKKIRKVYKNEER